MQLNKFTDYALRVLMYVAQFEAPHTVSKLAENLQVSENHLVKIVHFMAKQNWIKTVRGKGGGIYLNPEILQLQLGDVVQVLQGEAPIVNCAHPQCVLSPSCQLKGILDQAVMQFYASLNQYQLQDVLNLKSNPRSEITLLQL